MSLDLVSCNKNGNYFNLDNKEAYDLAIQCGDQARFTLIGWIHLLHLARFYGWEPLGTEDPYMLGWGTLTDVDFQKLSTCWDGNYYQNSGQIVTAADSTMLANALEKAVDTIPDTEVCNKDINMPLSEYPIYGQKLIENGVGSESGDNPIITTENPYLPPSIFFSGAHNMQMIRNFINLCRKGPFRIH
jgi:hypothetical protein